MTDQEMLNRDWNGLKSQGFERCYEDKACRSLDSQGRRCAASWVMAGEPWDDAQLGYEGIFTKGLDKVSEMGAEREYRGVRLPLGSQLGRAHDSASSRDEVERNLRELASLAGLEVPND